MNIGAPIQVVTTSSLDIDSTLGERIAPVQCVVLVSGGPKCPNGCFWSAIPEEYRMSLNEYKWWNPKKMHYVCDWTNWDNEENKALINQKENKDIKLVTSSHANLQLDPDRLSALPAELRLMIYSYVFEDMTTFTYPCAECPRGFSHSSWIPKYTGWTHINHRISAEANYYFCTRFLPRLYMNWGGPRSLTNTLNICADTCPDLFGNMYYRAHKHDRSFRVLAELLLNEMYQAGASEASARSFRKGERAWRWVQTVDGKDVEVLTLFPKEFELCIYGHVGRAEWLKKVLNSWKLRGLFGPGYRRIQG